MRPVSRRSVLVAMSGATASVAALLARPAGAEQSHMKAALDALQEARKELLAAGSSKGGHRAKALDYVKKAMVQVEKGIEYDRRN